MEWSEKQIQILEVAEKLFAENSYDGTSVRQIAKEADINIAMISYYFGSKDKMLEALLQYRIADFNMELETVLANNNDFAETIETIVKLIVQRIHRNRRIYKIIHFEYSNENRDINFDQFLVQKRVTYKIIEEFIQEGQAAGAFAQKLEISLLLPTIFGTYFHYYYNKSFFHELHKISKKTTDDEFVFMVLTPHIQQTIKALLTYGT